jgi:hypothetical protein
MGWLGKTERVAPLAGEAGVERVALVTTMGLEVIQEEVVVQTPQSVCLEQVCKALAHCWEQEVVYFLTKMR